MANLISQYEKRHDTIKENLAKKVIDVTSLKKSCWGGIPNKLRPKCWRIFLRTVNLKSDNYEMCINNKQTKYSALLSEMKISKKISHQIEIDVLRIDTKNKIFDNVDYSQLYIKTLSLYAYQRPAVGYVQGMSDILIPFVFVFVSEKENTKSDDMNLLNNNVGNDAYLESSVFFCFSRFIDRLQDNYIDFQEGIIKNIEKMRCILEIMEPDLMKYMNQIGFELHMFAFRWFNCFFTREFDIDNVLVIFDTLFSSQNENFALFARYFAITLLVSHKNKIMKTDLSTNLLYIQSIDQIKMSLKDVQILLSSAYVNQSIFNE